MILYGGHVSLFCFFLSICMSVCLFFHLSVSSDLGRPA